MEGERGGSIPTLENKRQEGKIIKLEGVLGDEGLEAIKGESEADDLGFDTFKKQGVTPLLTPEELAKIKEQAILERIKRPKGNQTQHALEELRDALPTAEEVQKEDQARRTSKEKGSQKLTESQAELQVVLKEIQQDLPDKEYFFKFENALRKDNKLNLEDLSQTEKESLALIEEKIKQARVESKTHKEAEEKFSEIINNTPTQEVINVLLGGNLSTYEVNTILRAKKDDPEILAAASIHKPAEVLSVLTQSDSEFSSEVIDTILENKPSILKTLDLDIQETIISNNPEYFIFADNRVQENYLNQNPEFLNTLKEKDKEEIINYLYSKNKDYDALSPILEKLSNSNQILEKLHPKKRLRMKIKLSNRNILRDRSALIESIQSGRINELDIIMGIDRNPDIKEDIYKTLKSINPKYYERLVNKAQKLFSFVGLPAEEQADLLEKGILEEKEILNYLSPAIYDKLLKPLREVQEKRRYFFHNIPGSIDMDKSTQPNLPTTIKNK